MAIYNFWRRLLDDDGIAVSGGTVYVYLASTTTSASIVDGTSTPIANPLTTNSNGEFNFYVEDYTEINGYEATQKFKLTWSGTSSGGDAVSGTVDNIDIFPALFPVDETDITSTDFNKLNSNDLAYDWEVHTTYTWQNSAHTMLPIDINDSTDATPNKLVSNFLMNQLDSLLASAQSPSIEATGALVITIDVGLSGSGEPVKWTPSAGTGFVYANINHGLDIDHPIVQVYEASGASFVGERTISIDSNNLRIFSTLNVESRVSVLG